MLEVLQAIEVVESAEIRTNSLIVVEITLPDDLLEGESTWINVQQLRVDDGAYQLDLLHYWFLGTKSAEYQAYVQNVLDQLLERIVVVCDR